MGFFSKVFKVAKIVGRAVAAYYTGGQSELAFNAASAITAKTPKANPITGQVSAADAAAADAASKATADTEEERKKRLALNAQSGDTTNSLGVTGAATVTKKRLLGA